MRTIQMVWCIACVLVSGVGLVFAETFTFVPASGDWNTTANWDPSNSIPGAADLAIIPNGKTCIVESSNQQILELRIAAGGVVDIRSRDLTFVFQGGAYPVLKNGGTLKFKRTSGSSPIPRILLETPLFTIQDESGNYGLISGCSANSCGPGIIQSSGTFQPNLPTVMTVTNSTIRGSLQFLKGSRGVYVKLSGANAHLEVDNANDLMEIGAFSAESPVGVLLSGDTTSGDVSVSAGELRFGASLIATDFTGTMYLTGGKITISPYFDSATDAGCKMRIDGGTLRVDGMISGVGGFILDSGRIEVDPDGMLEWE